jgi:2-succinyl-6-hydroxy-2,4-cyclohexadiene-1-carboxylate synthase
MIETVVLLHGFSGTSRAWDPVLEVAAPERYRPLALDLPGHGSAADVRPASIAACAEHVGLRAPERFALAGYSMGGRVALHVALSSPERVSRLVVIAASPGIEDPDERLARRASDEALARELEADGVEAFALSWGSQPLFAGQSPAVRRMVHADRLRNSPAGLAAALREGGTGTMAPMWHRLGELRMPVTVVVGERDGKFRAIGERMAIGIDGAQVIVVPAAGHALLAEAPEAVARVVLP